MNYNPLLVKNFLIGKIPFVKEKTLSLYKKYLSEGKFSQGIYEGDELTGSEILTAYTMLNNYHTDFVFDEGTIVNSTSFNQKEWDLLGMFLRAYAEIEGVNLLHLYNCLYTREGAIITGGVVTGRIYTLYSYSYLPITLSAKDFSGRVIKLSEIKEGVESDPENSLTFGSISKVKPIHFRVMALSDSGEVIPGDLVDFKLEFSSEANLLTALVEGNYPGYFPTSLDPYSEKQLIPENLRVGEYSRKLIEFLAGTLVTELSDPQLIANLSRELTGSALSFKQRVIDKTPGVYNKDGYMDRRIDL